MKAWYVISTLLIIGLIAVSFMSKRHYWTDGDAGLGFIVLFYAALVIINSAFIAWVSFYRWLSSFA